MSGRTFADSLAADLDVFFNPHEFGESLALQRGSKATTGLAPIVTTRRYDVTDESGAVTSYESIDLDLPTTSYAIEGVAVDPRPGDLLTSATATYEVLPIPRLGCFEPSADGRVLTIHAKRVP